MQRRKLDFEFLKDEKFLILSGDYVLGSHDSGFNAPLLIAQCGKV
jgi:hypothetical protein